MIQIVVIEYSSIVAACVVEKDSFTDIIRAYIVGAEGSNKCY